MDTRDELLVTLAEFVLDGFAMAHRGPCVNDLVYRTGHLDGLVSCKEKVKALRHKLHEELMSGNTDVMKGWCNSRDAGRTCCQFRRQHSDRR